MSVINCTYYRFDQFSNYRSRQLPCGGRKNARHLMKNDTFCGTASESNGWIEGVDNRWFRTIATSDCGQQRALKCSERDVCSIGKLISLFQLTTPPTAVITSPINFNWFNFSGRKKRHTATGTESFYANEMIAACNWIRFVEIVPSARCQLWRCCFCFNSHYAMRSTSVEAQIKFIIFLRHHLTWSICARGECIS